MPVLRFPVSAFMPPPQVQNRRPKSIRHSLTYRAARRELAKTYYRLHKRGKL